MVKHFHELFPTDKKWRDRAEKIAEKTHELSSFLVNVLKVENVGAKLSGKVTWHDACHALRDLGLKTEPRKLLQKVEEAEFVELNGSDECCGFGGTFATKFPMISTAMGEVKCASARDTTAEYMVSADSSCLMHLQGLLTAQKQPLKTIHIAEVLTARA